MPREFELIARHFAPMAGPAGLGLLDDAAVLRPPEGCDLVITKDALVAGVHFFAEDPPDAIGEKALAVNLSDLAAKGAAPTAYLLAIALPQDVDDRWIAAFANGLKRLAEASGCPLIGGDTVSTTGPLTICITAIGSVPTGAMVHRSGANPGDLLFVSGTIGDGALGLLARNAERTAAALQIAEDHARFLIDRYLRPRPRLALAEALRAHASAAMDVSDGFVGDLVKLVQLGGLGARVRLEDVPHSVAARSWFKVEPELKERALTGGDDYEIIATVPSAKAQAFASSAMRAGVRVTIVGEVLQPGQPLEFLDADGTLATFSRMSFEHLARS